MSAGLVLVAHQVGLAIGWTGERGIPRRAFRVVQSATQLTYLAGVGSPERPTTLVRLSGWRMLPKDEALHELIELGKHEGWLVERPETDRCEEWKA